jgi:hypothetical protein
VSPRSAGRIGWALCVVTLLAAVGQFVLRVPRWHDLAECCDPFPTFPIITVATLAAAVVGAVIVSRHPRNAVGWLFCITNCLAEIGLTGSAYADEAQIGIALPGASYASWVAGMTGSTFALSFLVFLLLLFPTGHLPSRRWRPIAWIAGANFALAHVVIAYVVGAPSRAKPRYDLEVEGLARSLLIGGQVVLLLCLLAAVGAVVVRRRRSTGEVRQQLRLFTLAAGVLGFSLVLIVLAEVPQGPGVPVVVAETAFYLSYGSLPVAAGLAILKYRLYEIDLILNRAIVIGAFTVVSTLGYVLVVVSAGSLLGDRIGSGTTVSLLATAVVALAVQPTRRRVKRFADRVVYGKRAAPYDVLAAFADRIRGTLSLDEVLPQMAYAAAQGIAARVAAVSVVLPDGARQTASWPPEAQPPKPDVLVPVLHLGEPVGEIVLELLPGTRLDTTSRQLLDDLATQAGLALHNVRLTADLRVRLEELATRNEAIAASRQRLVATQTLERQRLERQISEQVQPHLSALSAGLQEAQQLTQDIPACTAALDRLGPEATAALEALREIARGVFPPVLADRGLPAALESVGRSLGVHLALDVQPALPRCSPRSEAMAYFCCHEVLRESAAAGVPAQVAVRVVQDVLHVQADGRPLPAEVFAQLTDRVAAAGGSLDVKAGALTVELPATPQPVPVGVG